MVNRVNRVFLAYPVTLDPQEDKETPVPRAERVRMVLMENLVYPDLLETEASPVKMELLVYKVFPVDKDPRVTLDPPDYLVTRDRLESKEILDCPDLKDPVDTGEARGRLVRLEHPDLSVARDRKVCLGTQDHQDLRDLQELEDQEEARDLLAGLARWARKACQVWRVNLVHLDPQVHRDLREKVCRWLRLRLWATL